MTVHLHRDGPARLAAIPAALMLAALMAAPTGAAAQSAANGKAALKLATPVVTAAPSRAISPSATVQVVVRLTDKPLLEMLGANAKRAGTAMTLAQRQAYMASLKAKQDAISAQVKALGGTETSRVSKVLNAVVFSTRASTLPQIQRIAGVVSVRPLATYQKALGETVPYIGASTLQVAGLTGAGVKVAVLDSGIDYTHKNLGGSGTAADYAAATANPTVIPAGLYPTTKVVGGFDFTGSVWPNGPRSEDPNPIDDGVEGGHGTHVADIIGGKSQDGTRLGVAPGAQLYAVKVCSSVSTSCNGEAILKGLDWIVDPNGDLNFSDAADVVNLSLGSGYGQREDDSTLAITNVVRFGIVAAISAGNSADRPFILGSPSSAPEAISVAQTQVPSASTFGVQVTSPAAIAGLYRNTAPLDWAPVGAGFSGQVALISDIPGQANNEACGALPANSLAGKVALINRGSCNISSKVDNAANAGAIGTLIQLVAAGDATSFSLGGGSNFVPSLVIQQSLGNAIRANKAAPVFVTVDATTQVPLIAGVVGSSSRGPSYSYQQIKPEIGAPGASLSAEYGTGDGQTAFGGTSGAAPMVAGAAALLVQKFPMASAAEIKSRLMNGANSTIYTNPATQPGVLAPITRIGAGEVRVDKAAAITTGIWDATNPYNVGLSFGMPRTAVPTTLSKKVAVRNYSNTARTYTITRSFRYANDAASGAVTLSAPDTISVPANGSGAFVLTMRIDTSKLPAWNLAFPGNQGNGALLQGVEFDGYISLNDPQGSVSVPWHVLPHKAANVTLSSSAVALNGSGVGNLGVANIGGAATGIVDFFALTGTSPQITNVNTPMGSQNVLIDIKAVGVRDYLADDVVQFAVSTYGQRTHPSYPAEFDVYVDSNNDGIDDYVVYTAENGAFASSGQTLVYVASLSGGSATAYYYADADIGSSNMVLTVPASAIGVTSAGQKVRFSVYAFDNYFTGAFKDGVENMTYSMGLPKFAIDFDSFTLGSGGAGVLTVQSLAGGAAASPSQSGFLVVYGDSKTGRESDLVTVTSAAP